MCWLFSARRAGYVSFFDAEFHGCGWSDSIGNCSGEWMKIAPICSILIVFNSKTFWICFALWLSLVKFRILRRRTLQEAVNRFLQTAVKVRTTGIFPQFLALIKQLSMQKILVSQLICSYYPAYILQYFVFCCWSVDFFIYFFLTPVFLPPSSFYQLIRSHPPFLCHHPVLVFFFVFFCLLIPWVHDVSFFQNLQHCGVLVFWTGFHRSASIDTFVLLLFLLNNSTYSTVQYFKYSTYASVLASKSSS